MLFRGPYLAHWQLLHLAMILARKAHTPAAAPKSKFFQILKICDTVKKANNGRKKWQIHLVVH
jgi:hypothetical protein